MPRIPIYDPNNGERRIADAEFRAHMQDHLDGIDRQFVALGDRIEAYHQENTRRLQSLEESAKAAGEIVREWTGEGLDPENGMRRQLRQLIAERRMIGIGWKVLAAFGAVGTAVIAGWSAINAFLQAHK